MRLGHPQWRFGRLWFGTVEAAVDHAAGADATQGSGSRAPSALAPEAGAYADPVTAVRALLDVADGSVSRHLAFLDELDGERERAREALRFEIDGARAVAEAEIVLAHDTARRERETLLAEARERAREIEMRAGAQAERTLEWARAQAAGIVGRARTAAAQVHETSRRDAAERASAWPLPGIDTCDESQAHHAGAGASGDWMAPAVVIEVPLRPSWWDG